MGSPLLECLLPWSPLEAEEVEEEGDQEPALGEGIHLLGEEEVVVVEVGEEVLVAAVVQVEVVDVVEVEEEEVEDVVVVMVVGVAEAEVQDMGEEMDLLVVGGECVCV